MNKRQFKICATFFLALMCAGFWLVMPKVLAVEADDGPSFTILSPAERQYFEAGDMVEIQFKAHNFKPNDRQGITVRLAERNTWGRVRIGYIIQPQEDDIYLFKWTIPEDFFERNSFPSPSYFKIELRANVDSKLVRKISTLSLFYIKEMEQEGVVSEDVETIVSVPVSEEEPDAEPQSSVIVGKESIATYQFQAKKEPVFVRKLSIVNDADGDGFDYDPSESTNLIDKVYIRYPNTIGSLEIKSSSLVNGKATFSNLDFYVDRDKPSSLEIFVDLADFKTFGEQYSGRTFRVGLQTIGNTVDTFMAVGKFSVALYSSLDDVQLSAGKIEEFVVRSGMPTFTFSGLPERVLDGGAQDVFDFSLSGGENFALGRLVFDVSQVGLDSIDEVKLFRNDEFLNPGDDGNTGDVYLMWDAGATSCFAHTSQNGIGSGMNCNGSVTASSKLIVAFSKEERIADDVNDYRLRLTATGASRGDRISVRLIDNDYLAKPNIGGAVSTTGKIFNSGAGNELFSNASDFVSEATSITDRNIIWTDRSANLHSYPAIIPAVLPVVDASSSSDFTNGYLIDVGILPIVNSTK